jgi:hypothetical protein
MGSLAATQSAHWLNSCTRALQAGGRSGALQGVLPVPGEGLETLLHLPTIASMHTAHDSILQSGAREGPLPAGARLDPCTHTIPPFTTIHIVHPTTHLPSPNLLTRLLQRNELGLQLAAMPAIMTETMMVNSQQPSAPLAPCSRVVAPTFFQEQQASVTLVLPPAPRAWLHYYNHAHSTQFTYFTKDTPQGSPHGLYLCQALIATHLGTSMPSHRLPWKTAETCNVQGCSKDFDAARHH